VLCSCVIATAAYLLVHHAHALISRLIGLNAHDLYGEDICLLNALIIISSNVYVRHCILHVSFELTCVIWLHFSPRESVGLYV